MADRNTPPRGYTTEDVEVQKAARPRRHLGKKILAFVIGVPLLVLALWMVIVLNWSYSTGERGGYVQKFSRKGFLCKTWEGELAMVNIPGSMPQIFQFSVHHDDVAKRIEQAVTSGERVALHYEQHIGVPTSCFGETQYWVTQVNTAAPTTPATPATPPTPVTPTPPATTTPPPATPPATTPPR